MSDIGRRRAIIPISSQCFVGFFKAGRPGYEMVVGLPSDAILIDIRFNAFVDRVEAVIQSAAFDPVPDGNPPPLMDMVVREIRSSLDLSASSLN